MSAEGPSFLNLYETDKKKKLQPYPEARAPAVVTMRERDKAWEEKGKAVKLQALQAQIQERVAPPALLNKYVAEHYSPQEKADEYNRTVQLGMSESNKLKMRETQAEVDRREEERKAKIKAKTEIKVDIVLAQGYMDAIKVPDTYFNIITSSRTT